MKRLLCIISAMNTGGAETFLMKLYRKLDRTKFQMDFCVNAPEKGFYDEDIAFPVNPAIYPASGGS